MNNKDMYYNAYGYGGFLPLTTPNQNIQMPTNSYIPSQLTDMNERINRLERQIKRMEQRLTRLETPYANTNQPYNNEPDNNMYMM